MILSAIYSATVFQLVYFPFMLLWTSFAILHYFWWLHCFYVLVLGRSMYLVDLFSSWSFLFGIFFMSASSWQPAPRLMRLGKVKALCRRLSWSSSPSRCWWRETFSSGLSAIGGSGVGLYKLLALHSRTLQTTLFDIGNMMVVANLRPRYRFRYWKSPGVKVCHSFLFSANATRFVQRVAELSCVCAQHL